MRILGIDQGSTHTRAAVCDEAGRILGYSRSAGACHQIHGMEAAMGSVRAASEAALAEAGATGKVEMLFGGLTGADWPDEYGLLRDNLLDLEIAEEVKVVNDCIVAMRGGTHAPYGSIVIAGTGANCAIRSPEGEEYIYHFYMEDYLQGGTGLGRSALWAVYRAESGREPPTLLKQAILEELRFENVDALLRAQVERRLSPEAVKELAPLVLRLAHEGDPAAFQAARRFALGMAELVAVGLKRFGMTEIESEVVVSGSIFKGFGRMLVEMMEEEIHKTAPKAKLVNARYEPVVGALMLGLEACGIAVEGEIERNIEAGSRAYGLLR